MKHIVIFSHGFGVRQDSRGMFTEIAAALQPDIQTVTFDDCDWDDTTQTLTVPPITARVGQRLSAALDGKVEH